METPNTDTSKSIRYVYLVIQSIIIKHKYYLFVTVINENLYATTKQTTQVKVLRGWTNTTTVFPCNLSILSEKEDVWIGLPIGI